VKNKVLFVSIIMSGGDENLEFEEWSGG